MLWMCVHLCFSSAPVPGHQVNAFHEKSIHLRTKVFQKVKKKQNYRNTTQNLQSIIVDIFFGNLVYTRIEEKVLMDFTYFVSQLGGQLSMWLGKNAIGNISHIAHMGYQVHRRNSWFLNRELDFFQKCADVSNISGIRLVTIVHILYYGTIFVFEILPVWYKRARKWQNENWKYATSVAQRVSSTTKASVNQKRMTFRLKYSNQHSNKPHEYQVD